MAATRRTPKTDKPVEVTTPQVERPVKQFNRPGVGRLSSNNRKLSESLLDLMWTLVDNGVVSVDDAGPTIEVLADIVDGIETQ